MSWVLSAQGYGKRQSLDNTDRSVSIDYILRVYLCNMNQLFFNEIIYVLGVTNILRGNLDATGGISS